MPMSVDGQAIHKSVEPLTFRFVGCPPVAAGHCRSNHQQREGVVQASREETAASAAAVGVSYTAMGI